MSIKHLSEVWENGPKDKGELLVLLALADYADARGQCWPSMCAVARKARMTERGAQKIVRRLIEDGWVSTETGGGRGASNRYVVALVNPEPGSEITPETPNEKRCLPFETPNAVPETPNAVPINPEPGSGEPLRRTTKNQERASFASFWGEWPNRVGKAAAEKAWGRLKSPDREAVIASAGRWFREWRAKFPDAAPIHPATFLNQRRWEDEGLGTAKTSSGLDEVMRMKAQWIREKKTWLLGSITPREVEELIGAGYLTEKEFRDM